MKPGNYDREQGELRNEGQEIEVGVAGEKHEPADKDYGRGSRVTEKAYDKPVEVNEQANDHGPASEAPFHRRL
jgi:hypothetical protein